MVVNNEVNWDLNSDTTNSKVKGTKGRLRILLLSLKLYQTNIRLNTL